MWNFKTGKENTKSSKQSNAIEQNCRTSWGKEEPEDTPQLHVLAVQSVISYSVSIGSLKSIRTS